MGSTTCGGLDCLIIQDVVRRVEEPKTEILIKYVLIDFSTMMMVLKVMASSLLSHYSSITSLHFISALP